MIHRCYITLICLLIMHSNSVGRAIARADQFYLVKEGKETAAIVISSTASEAERFAAEGLQNYIEKMSSVQLPLQTDAETVQGNLIFVGSRQGDFLKKNKIEMVDSLGEEDFIIRTGDNRLLLVGGGDWGTVYAVYTFLETLGCRWFMPGPLGEVIPKQKTIGVNGLNIIERPSFKYRRVGYADAEWGLRTKSNNFVSMYGLKGYEGFGGHAYFSLVPPEEYFEKHPEYFALWQGKRVTNQICLSNAEVVRIVVSKANQYFDEHPDDRTLSFSLSPNDYSQFCECEGCLRVGPTISDRVMAFTNTVAKEVRRQHPDKLLNVYAYDGYIDPPKTIEKMEDNVAIIICRITEDGVYSFPITSDDQYSVRIRNIIEKWVAMAEHILFYDYYAHYDWFAPWPLEKTIAPDFRYYRSLGAKVEGLVPEMHPHWGTQGLNNYVMAKLSWNVNLNLDSLVNDYYTKFYGRAASEVKAYFEVFAEQFRTLQIPFWGQMGKWMEINTPDVLARAREHLSRAKKLANDSLIVARVHLLELGLGYVEHKTKFQKDRNDSGNFALALRRMNALEAHVKSFPPDQVLQTSQALYNVRRSRRYLMEDIARLERNGVHIDTAEVGKEIAFMKDWHVIGPFSNLDNKGWDTEYPPEKEINFQRSYQGKNGGEVKWQLVKSSTNRINLDKIYRNEEWAVGYAVSYVYSPEPRSAFLALGSDDGIVAWVNGEQVGADKAWRTANAFQDAFPVVLQKGWNTVLLKITQGEGEWGFYASMVNDKVQPIPHLKYAAKISK